MVEKCKLSVALGRSPSVAREGLPPPARGLFMPASWRAFFFGATSSPRHTQRGPRITRAPAKTPLEIYRRSFPLLNSLSRSAKKRGARGRRAREAGRAGGRGQGGGGGGGRRKKKNYSDPRGNCTRPPPPRFFPYTRRPSSLSSFLCAAAILHQPSFGSRARLHLYASACVRVQLFLLSRRFKGSRAPACTERGCTERASLAPTSPLPVYLYTAVHTPALYIRNARGGRWVAAEKKWPGARESV